MDRSQRERLWNNMVSYLVHSMIAGKPSTTLDEIIETSLGDESWNPDEVGEANDWLRRNTTKIQQAAVDAAVSIKKSGSELHQWESSKGLELDQGWGKAAERTRPGTPGFITPDAPLEYCPQCNKWVGPEHAQTHITTPPIY